MYPANTAISPESVWKVCDAGSSQPSYGSVALASTVICRKNYSIPAYAALAAFLGLLPDFGWSFDSAFFFAAHLWRILSAAASLCAAVKWGRFLLVGAGLAAVAVTATGFFGGRPLRFVGP